MTKVNLPSCIGNSTGNSGLNVGPYMLHLRTTFCALHPARMRSRQRGWVMGEKARWWLLVVIAGGDVRGGAGFGEVRDHWKRSRMDRDRDDLSLMVIISSLTPFYRLFLHLAPCLATIIITLVVQES